ncbi:uncharacterized protein F5891DRAFT_1282093 [Suillus fuscotomentosus]|uniref:Uncharacterized protein n=1 Tax=Suillus fuscotomentosus TaxID=1912939 RepID=A0AAD4DUM3_9AGAM|nr:uncharacterized protein F5891DRAFT_1282093 [Suillus fuscotomentosus]KAG1893464.1 hypothetical protein F5891DRAFT_1282093 [Suillus fuscotomentosus]
MLLQWYMLSPAGPSKLSAIRFSSPSRVHSIKIFPTDVQPPDIKSYHRVLSATIFHHHAAWYRDTHIVGRTGPEAYFLDVYVNAYPVGSLVDAKQKLKAPNALMPTVIPYAGGVVEYAVNTSSEFATRSTIPTTDSPLLTHSSVPLVPALDATKSNDPNALARNLLALFPNAPSLSLVTRLMFCLKQPNDDSNLPELPHLYSDLNEEEVDID